MKIIFFFFLVFLLGCSGNAPPTLGHFAKCPDKPNCVSSKSTLSLHAIAPLTYKGSQEEAKQKLLEIIKSMPRTQVVTDRENFLHIEFTSKIFRFIDDVEFYFEDSGTIHFRSASRVGHSDMGVNSERMEEIRRQFSAG
tara:strand:+ start:446 stop:862 length:417 start_codon:yes stop_codon:yes gene_type:complete